MADCNKVKLKKDIKSYWRKPNDPHRYTNYIKNILPREMACAYAEKTKRLPEHKCEQLVFLVGHSLEPLFQSVWAYQPQQVLLILSQSYGDETGQSWGGEVKCLLEKELSPQADIKISKVIPEVIKDTSTKAVFQKLQEHIRQDPQPRPDGTRPVIIDITGAKKSMVAGAFLFAAYAGVPVSYVDFDDDAYDMKAGHPYGYACRIGEVSNPYQDFALRNWEQVRTLYTRYNFRGVRQMLEEKIIPAMGQFFPEQIKNVERLIAILNCYELWDNGDFSGAKQMADKIQGFTPPAAVDVLGKDGYWPHGHTPDELLVNLKRIEFGQLPDHSDTLYLSPQRLATYTRDEIARVSRLIRYNEDYRSALLRAVSLWEILLRARVIGLWHSDLMEIANDRTGDYAIKSNAPAEIKNWKTEVYEAFIWTNSGDVNIPGLRYDDIGKYKKKSQKLTCYRDKNKPSQQTHTFYLRRSLSAPKLTNVILIGNVKDLRDKAIHTYLSVPQKIAKETYDVVLANLKDYEQAWLPAIWPNFTPDPTNVERMPWSELWQLCGLDFLPANLKRDQDRKEII